MKYTFLLLFLLLVGCNTVQPVHVVQYIPIPADMTQYNSAPSPDPEGDQRALSMYLTEIEKYIVTLQLKLDAIRLLGSGKR